MSGKTLKLGKTEWHVVGLFSAGGGMGESELWTDTTVLQEAYQRGDSFQSVYARLETPGKFQEFKDSLTSNPQLKVKVVRQAEFYSEQASLTTDFITGIGTVIALMMALGALLGALNTMYNAVASRGREIATLRALGFGATPVVCSVLIESLVLALVGGVIGGLGAYLAFDGYGAATMNFQTFSQIAFAFAVTPQLLLNAIILAATDRLARRTVPGHPRRTTSHCDGPAGGVKRFGVNLARFTRQVFWRKAIEALLQLHY